MDEQHAEAGSSRHTSAVSRDAATVEGWGSIQWLVNSRFSPGSKITFGYVEILPGEKNPRHLHPNCDEVLFLIEGQLDHSIGDEMVRMAPSQAVFVAAGVPHDARNVGNVVARMVVAFPTDDRQVVMLEAGNE